MTSLTFLILSMNNSLEQSGDLQALEGHVMTELVFKSPATARARKKICFPQ